MENFLFFFVTSMYSSLAARARSQAWEIKLLENTGENLVEIRTSWFGKITGAVKIGR